MIHKSLPDVDERTIYLYHTLTLPVHFRINQNVSYVIEVQTRNKNFKDEWRRLVPAAQCKPSEEPPPEVEEEVGFG